MKMNLVSFSIKTKGLHNFIRRLGTVFTRFGFTETRTRRALYTIINTVRKYDGFPTFYIPAVVLERHPKLIAGIGQGGTEIGVHGYVHNDYRTLNKEQQFKQTQQAINIFKHANVPFYGFRNPYLGWTRESLEVFAALGFHYESNIAVLHDVVDLDAFSPLIRSGFEKSLKLFQAIPCNTYALRPQFDGELLRIPTSIPDDEMLFDRLRITNPEEVGRIWSKIMKRVYDLGGLYALNLHPERGMLCQRALDTLLSSAVSQELPVWVTRIGDIAQWWKERSRFKFNIVSLDDHRWQVTVDCSERATILVRHLTIENSPVSPWFGVDERVQIQSFVAITATCPCIGVSQQTSEEVMAFLTEQGYVAKRCTREETLDYTLYIDNPAGFGSTPERKAECKSALVEQIEALEKPLLRFGCWPDGNRAALAISGDIDSVTVQDFFLRIAEVFRHN
jgi:peptidoglycan/xylan/chitin deacetylase (PgdA/CDA1 family)